jgi:hypothetical protein
VPGDTIPTSLVSYIGWVCIVGWYLVAAGFLKPPGRHSSSPVDLESANIRQARAFNKVIRFDSDI